MNILYIAHRIPYPPNKGDKIRSFNEIKYLSRTNAIHLACLADRPEDLKYEGELKKYCASTKIVHLNPIHSRVKCCLSFFDRKPFSVPYFYSKELQDYLDELLLAEDIKCIFCYSSQTAEYIFRSSTFARRKKASREFPKLIMDFVDVDSQKWAQYARHSSWPKAWIFKTESRRLASYERKIAVSYDHSLFVSEEETKLFKSKNGDSPKVSGISNGVDLDYFCGSPSARKSNPILLFPGAMDYYANIDGVSWFARDILPEVWQNFPEAEFYIVGSNPAKEVQRIGERKGIRVTGFVEDIRPYYNLADICVVPLRIAQGIQNKLLEAMAMGKAVISTSKALEGIKAVPGKDLLVADSPAEFQAAIERVFRDPKLKDELGRAARKTVEKHYRWDANMEKIHRVIQKISEE